MVKPFSPTYIALVDRVAFMVDAADTEPLVGMALMYGYELNVQIVDGGAVTLRRFSNP